MPEVLDIWNLMGGEINWAALPLLAEMKGVQDIEMLIIGLTAIREHFRPPDEAQQNQQ